MERVISKTVLGSANPFARKFRGIKNSISGVGCGFVFILVSFFLIFASVRLVTENSKIVENLTLQDATGEVVEDNGLVKIQGPVEITDPLVFEYSKCANPECTQSDDSQNVIEDQLFLEATFERFEVVEKTRTETRTYVENGQDVQETVEITEYEEEWVEKSKETFWSDFNVGNVTVEGERAKQVFETVEQEIPNAFIPNLRPVETYGQTISSQVGSTRIIVKTFDTSGDLIVVGNIKDKRISSGAPFVISDKTDAELVDSLHTEETIARWSFRLIAWAFLTIGLTMLLGPILELTDIIPLVGTASRMAAGFASAIIAAIIVLGGVLIVKFWYICIAGIIILPIVTAVLMVRKKKKDTQANL